MRNKPRQPTQTEEVRCELNFEKRVVFGQTIHLGVNLVV
jgi:hypothetical protein